MTTASTRRSLFAGAGAVVMGAGITAGAAASVVDYAEAAAAPSPIISAGLQMKNCWDRHDAAENRNDWHGQTAAAAEKRRHEEFILASTPTTLAECALVLMVAVAEIDFGQNAEDGFEIVDAAEWVCERVTKCLFDLAGLDLNEFAVQFYTRQSDLAPALARRA